MKTESVSEGNSKMQLETCVEHIRYARAADLARSKNYLEAEAMLAPMGIIPETARELDLLARIATLQKQFKRAEKLWEAALQKSPGNEVYSECLQGIRTLDPSAEFPKTEKETDLVETILFYVALVIAILGFATIIWAFWPKK